jgi:hypothetical protein
MPGGRRVVWVVLEGGTLTSSDVPAVGRPLVLPAPSGAVWSGAGCGGQFVGTLLGPEGAGNRCLGRAALDLIPLAPVRRCRVGGVGSGWWLFGR